MMENPAKPCGRFCFVSRVSPPSNRGFVGFFPRDDEKVKKNGVLGGRTLILASDLDPIVVYRGVNSYAVDIIKWRIHDGLLQERMKEKNKSHASYKRVYIANWVIIYHLPPIKI